MCFILFHVLYFKHGLLTQKAEVYVAGIERRRNTNENHWEFNLSSNSCIMNVIKYFPTFSLWGEVFSLTQHPTMVFIKRRGAMSFETFRIRNRDDNYIDNLQGNWWERSAREKFNLLCLESWTLLANVVNTWKTNLYALTPWAYAERKSTRL